MITSHPPQTEQFDVATIMGGLYGDGIIGLKGAFEGSWIQKMGEEIEVLYRDALQRPGGAVGRGPKRHYVEVHPQDISGFVDLSMHPWVIAVCEAVLGPEFKIVEIGFDVPNPGAVHQPWHRDFPAPQETVIGRRLNSLAFNLTTVDVSEIWARSRSPRAHNGTSRPNSSTGCSLPSAFTRAMKKEPNRKCRRWATSRYAPR